MSPDCRQMCLSCQFVDNPKKEGIECATAPYNWTFGDTRMRCNFRCIIEGHFDKESGMPAYFYRGCSASNDLTSEKCYEDEARVYCSFSCVDDDYCNSRVLMPSSNKKSSALRVTTSFVEMLAGTALGLYIVVRF
ncbi:hypothetical protein C0Q70_04402 [Pomacea canaliculata]|uniref:UPAR/Ly6 domain-containing protein n=2 Tax=Pomacea canaliculata TaxID=400727 RepID=A0A2T7PVF8_POMCA|nr:hypothetical protein C0Q70_04402 [Pomacea canaliculata]